MTFGERLTQVRKRKNLSQAEIGKKIGINGDAYGRYERNDVRPTIEMAVKIAQALEISLDYLTGTSDIELDKATLDRVQEITKLNEKDKDYILLPLMRLFETLKINKLINKKLFFVSKHIFSFSIL